jgi:phage-related protein
VAELKVKYRGEYRVFYTVNLGDAVYIISAFRKKTQKTPKAEIDLAKARLAELKKTLWRK